MSKSQVPASGSDEMPFGKYRGKPLDMLPVGYWRWLLEKGDNFPDKWPDIYAYAVVRVDDPNTPQEERREYHPTTPRRVMPPRQERAPQQQAPVPTLALPLELCVMLEDNRQLAVKHVGIVKSDKGTFALKIVVESVHDTEAVPEDHSARDTADDNLPF